MRRSFSKRRVDAPHGHDTHNPDVRRDYATCRSHFHLPRVARVPMLQGCLLSEKPRLLLSVRLRARRRAIGGGRRLFRESPARRQGIRPHHRGLEADALLRTDVRGRYLPREHALLMTTNTRAQRSDAYYRFSRYCSLQSTSLSCGPSNATRKQYSSLQYRGSCQLAGKSGSRPAPRPR
jgi:hypothetical protein